ncbi:MAG: tetratricopeptide repeat protein [Pseudomonadota bacterium]
MSLLMKALQQAAQNRSAREPGQPVPGDEPSRSPAPGDGGDPAAPGPESEVAAGSVQAPAAADPAVPTGELALEPIFDAVPWREAEAQPERPATAQGTARADAPDQRTTGSSRFPAGGVAAPEVRPSSPARAQGAPQPDAGAPVLPDIRQDRRKPPRWSGDLQEGDARQAATDAADDRALRRGPARAEGSPERAGSVLAAGAGASRPGVLSRLTRLQWIIAAGVAAGTLLFAYFYIQISYPGLLQRGFRSPSLVSPVAVRPAQPTALAPAAPAPPPTPLSIAPLPAPTTGAAQPIGAGTPPAGPATAPGVPAALAGSPLLSPAAAAETPSSAAVAASPAQPYDPRVPAGAAGAVNARPVPGMPRTAASGTAADGGAVSRTAAGPVSQPGPSGMTTPAAVGTPTASAPTAARPAESALARTPPAAPAAESIRVLRGSTAAPVNPALADAYDHLQAGRIESAQRLYNEVASAEPRNVDALLGLAAVAQLGNQPEAASRLWLRVLEVEPRNAHAQAALIGQLGRADPVAAESQLKTLISREPSAFLYFTLGNLYADQNRWAQAQQAYFQAHHLQPGNADYAFNLAVGLERISQPRLAINYLRIAIRLAEAGARTNFDLPSARKRAALLEAAHGAP